MLLGPHGLAGYERIKREYASLPKDETKLDPAQPPKTK
jgi:hypothetical protein